MNLQLKRLKELFGYARTLTREQGLGTMLGRAAGFARRRLLPRPGRYLPGKRALELQRGGGHRQFPGHQHPDPPLQHPAALSGPLSGQRPEPDLRPLAALPGGCLRRRPRLCGGDGAPPPPRDPRIRYEKIDNTGIAANTNRAAALADGEYLALADHDDELAPHAVYTMGRAILAGGGPWQPAAVSLQ